jgi:hypothetical protein
MDIQLANVKEIVEVNSTYISGELKRKFVEFIESRDNMGLRVDGILLDLGGHETEFEEDGGVVEASEDEEIKDIPSVWILIDDNSVPIFKPLKTDALGTDYLKALRDHALDIILLKTEFTEKIKKLKIKIDDEILEKIGTLREIQEYIINSFEFKENKQQVLDSIQNYFFEFESVQSIQIDIPAHKKHILIGITNV